MIKIEKENLIDKLVSSYLINKVPMEEVMIFGIQNEDNKNKDVINDVIGIFYKQKDLYLMDGTTNSGKHYIQNPMNKDGAAQLDYGYQSKIWKVGKHNNKYEALVSRTDCNPVRIWRDKNKDYNQNDSERTIEGYFGTNLHNMGTKDRDTIGLNSAGCQVVKNIGDWSLLLSMIKDSDAYLKIKTTTYFSYYLFRKEEMEELYNEVYKNV